jgi:hypothetical protein
MCAIVAVGSIGAVDDSLVQATYIGAHAHLVVATFVRRLGRSSGL